MQELHFSSIHFILIFCCLMTSFNVFETMYDTKNYFPRLQKHIFKMTLFSYKHPNLSQSVDNQSSIYFIQSSVHLIHSSVHFIQSSIHFIQSSKVNLNLRTICHPFISSQVSPDHLILFLQDSESKNDLDWRMVIKYSNFV